MNWPLLSDLAGEIADGKRSAAKLVNDCLKQIEKHQASGAILEVNEAALARAEELDKAVKAGKVAGKLLGVPFIAKDNFLTFNTRSTAASNILKDFKAPYQATVIEKLEAEGAILVAKANLDAFGHGASTENSDFGVTRNPVDASRVAGGSSGGSAAAIALGLAAFALGTDTGGSSRQPASFSGVVGFKPTYGLISRYGVIAMASSTDTIGLLTRQVEDTAFLLDVLAGQDPLDATTVKRQPDYTGLIGDMHGVRVGLIKEQLGEGVDAAIVESVKKVAADLEAAGAEVKEISIPNDDLALAAYYIVQPAEVSSNLARYDGVKYGYSDPAAKNLEETYQLSRGRGFGAEAKRRIIIGTFVLSSGYIDAYYKKAQTVRSLLIKQYADAFKEVDILLGPTTPTTAFKIGANTDPLDMYLQDVMTVSASLVGIPAISVPAGNKEGLPIGVQLMAAQNQEPLLLLAAQAVEEGVNSWS